MVLRIEKSKNSKIVIFTLSGRLEIETISELKEVLARQGAHKKIALDLEDVKLIDHHSVKFLAECETQGIELRNCPVYLREWILRMRS